VSPQSIAEVARFETDTARPALIRSRLVTRSAVRAAVMAAVTPGGIPLVPIGSPATRSNLVKKLERGGIGPTTIRSAQRLRAIWSELEARYRTDLPSSNTEIEDIRTRVMDLVAAAEGQLPRRAPGEPYGQDLMTIVRALVRVDGLGRVPGLPIEDRHLLGLVYQLTDECEVWWSEEFDLESAAS